MVWGYSIAILPDYTRVQMSGTTPKSQGKYTAYKPSDGNGATDTYVFWLAVCVKL